MTTTATQLPFVTSTAQKAGRGLWRQQVLPLGSVEHPSKGKLEFSADVLKELVATFDLGAMDQVAYCLVTDDNKHTDDPERHRGEIRRLELGDDGLYAVIDPSERGRELLAENPRQPVSARITVPETGDFAGRPVLVHVAATPDPVAKGMKPGEWVDASAQVDELVDLSDGCFSTGGVAKDGTADTEGKDALDFSDEEKGALKSFFAKLGIGSKPDADKDDDKPSDADFEAALAELIAEADAEPEADKDADKDKEPVPASLSGEDRQALDMANERADRADIRAATTDLSSRLDQLVRDGVPPAMVQVTRDQLIGESDEQKRTLIDFANDRKPAAVEIALATLEAAKGTVDFTENGTSLVIDEEDEESKKLEKQIDATVEGFA